MSASTLAAGALLEAAAFASCVLAARAVQRRGPGAERDATLAYAGFWATIGIVHALQGALSAYAAVATVGLPLALALWQARMALLLFAFFGLVYYLLVIYTGDRRVLVPLVAYYALTLVGAMWFIGWAAPAEAYADPWRVALRFERPLEGPGYAALVLALFGPPLAAAIAYGMLARKVTDATRRRRILLTTASFALYFAALIAGYATLAVPLWGALEMALGALAALGVVWAHREPPKAAGATPIDGALQARIRALI